jgi:hypothetical protein
MRKSVAAARNEQVFAQIGLLAGQHDQAGAGERCEDGEQEPDVGGVCMG